MDFFDKLGKKVSEGYNAAAERTSKLTREAKLKLSIAESKSKIDEEYKKIGEKVYEKFLDSRDHNIAMTLIEEFKTIDALKESIKNNETEILNLKDKKKCEKCGKEYDESFEFCPNCGSENKKEEPQVFEAEVVQQNANDEEGKSEE